MSVATELTRIQTAKADIKASIEAKGVTVPSSALIDEYADYVDEIQTGGGGGQAEEDLKNLIERDITSITIPSGITTIGRSAFNYCTNLTSVTISDSVISIGDFVFYHCTSLAVVNIPNSVTSIGSESFEECSSLTSVTIPSGVTSIGAYAFLKCTGLTSITIQCTTPPILGNSANPKTFDNTNNCPIYVPAESVETYKAASRWSTYADRIQAIPSE